MLKHAIETAEQFNELADAIDNAINKYGAEANGDLIARSLLGFERDFDVAGHFENVESGLCDIYVATWSYRNGSDLLSFALPAGSKRLDMITICGALEINFEPEHAEESIEHPILHASATILDIFKGVTFIGDKLGYIVIADDVLEQLGNQPTETQLETWIAKLRRDVMYTWQGDSDWPISHYHFGHINAEAAKDPKSLLAAYEAAEVSEPNLSKQANVEQGFIAYFYQGMMVKLVLFGTMP